MNPDETKMVDAYRELVLRVGTSGFRTAKFDGRDHLIVPVVALVEGVIHAVNAKNPELVLASEFGKFPLGWNGEPVVMGHPMHEDGSMVSANTPEMLEKYQIGRIFGTKVDGKRLLMDAYLDLNRVEMVGLKAQEIVQKIEGGQLSEISVGTFVHAEEAPGVYNGRKYSRVWRNIVPDHLAFLESGVIGACSNEAGCGAGLFRAATVHVVTTEGLTLEGAAMGEENKDGAQKKSLLEKLKDMIAGEAETSAETPVPPAVPPAPPVAAASGCKCHEQNVSAESAKGGEVHKNAERITALIANPKTPWSEHDRTHLEGKTDEQLATLEGFGKEPEAKTEPVAAAAAPKAEAKIEDLPAPWQAIIRAAEENEKKHRTTLVDKLVAAQDGFSKEELTSMDFVQLQKLGKAILNDASVVDFSAAAGAPRSAAANTDGYADDAPDLGSYYRKAAQ